MKEQFKQTIDQAGSVVILLPKNPYFDQVAAGLSLYLSLRDQKSVEIYSPNPMLVEFNRLVGVNKVATELGNKNLIVSFADYDAENIERVKYDIENKQFKLTVIPKPQSTPPNKDQVILSYAGVSADIAILIGGANDSHFPALANADFAGTKLLHVGISDLRLSGKDVISFARSASSISEVVYPLVREITGKPSPDISSNLLAGIHEGSRGFTHSMVTADTYKMAAELSELGGKYVNTSGKNNQPQRNFDQPAQPQEESPKQTASEVNELPEGETPPRSWLEEPKVYRGASDPSKQQAN